MNGTTPVEAVALAAQSAGVGQDPILQGLGWMLAMVFLVIAIGKPLRDYLKSDRRESSSDRVHNAKASAESVLYNHLSQQVTEYRNIADQAFRERNELISRVAALEAVQLDFAETKELVEKLKLRLDDKDEQIKTLLSQGADERRQFLSILQTKEAEIAKRDERISTLESRQLELEIRLAKDEASMGVPVGCPFHGAATPLTDLSAALGVPESGAAG